MLLQIAVSTFCLTLLGIVCLLWIIKTKKTVDVLVSSQKAISEYIHSKNKLATTQKKWNEVMASSICNRIKEILADDWIAEFQFENDVCTFYVYKKGQNRLRDGHIYTSHLKEQILDVVETCAFIFESLFRHKYNRYVQA